MAKSLLAGLFILMLGLGVSPVQADEIRASFLSIEQLSNDAFAVRFNVPARGATQRLALNAYFDDSVEEISPRKSRMIDGSYVTQWQIRHPQQLSGAQVWVAGLERTPVDVLVRVEWLERSPATLRLTSAAPSAVLTRQQSWLQVASSYLVLGVEHILEGFDHLLFVLALLFLIRDRMKLIGTITAFTVAHSLTLALSALQWITLPVPPVEASIALSIVFVATEILHLQRGQPTLSQNRPWLVAFGFGLLHGLGFAAVLGEIGLPEDALITALVLFNVGVEIGQLIFVGAVLLLYMLVRRWLEPVAVLRYSVPAYLIGSIASFWFIERVVSFWAA